MHGRSHKKSEIQTFLKFMQETRVKQSRRKKETDREMDKDSDSERTCDREIAGGVRKELCLREKQKGTETGVEKERERSKEKESVRETD